MTAPLSIVALTLLAGGAIPLGALLARFERIRPRWLEDEFRHGVIAFGGGALLSAVALVLVPEGMRALSPLPVLAWFLAGGMAFMALDILLAARRSPASQLVAMLSDFLPEALALGAAFATGGGTAALLAGLIALQNLPEGFNAAREISAASGRRPGARLIGAFCAIALLGPAAGLCGHFWLSERPHIVGAVELFAAGGILYIVFQDIAPQARLQRHWTPALGAVAGFALGLLGKLLVEG